MTQEEAEGASVVCTHQNIVDINMCKVSQEGDRKREIPQQQHRQLLVLSTEGTEHTRHDGKLTVFPA